MHRNHTHWIRLSNNNPENPIGKFRHFAQTMLQLGIDIIILDKIRARDHPLHPSRLELSLGHASNSVLSVVDFHWHFFAGHLGNVGHACLCACAHKDKSCHYPCQSVAKKFVFPSFPAYTVSTKVFSTLLKTTIPVSSRTSVMATEIAT